MAKTLTQNEIGPVTIIWGARYYAVNLAGQLIKDQAEALHKFARNGSDGALVFDEGIKLLCGGGPIAEVDGCAICLNCGHTSQVYQRSDARVRWAVMHRCPRFSQQKKGVAHARA